MFLKGEVYPIWVEILFFLVKIHWCAFRAH